MFVDKANTTRCAHGWYSSTTQHASTMTWKRGKGYRDNIVYPGHHQPTARELEGAPLRKGYTVLTWWGAARRCRQT